MESNGEIYLSPKYRKNDYFNLGLEMDSSDKDWEKAIAIFDDRINGRFFNQIKMLSNDIKANGFIIMALNCLLIETLFQFKNGSEETPIGKNRSRYIEFLTEEISQAFNSKTTEERLCKAERFYKDIRCGILHSAQTKGKTMLTDDNNYVTTLNKGVFKVSVQRLTDELMNYFDNYKEKLIDKSQEELRVNFIKKMNFVCREYSI